MTSARIIIIGTELLLGEIQDTNTQYLAMQLREVGIDLFQVTVVGDNENRIANAITDAVKCCEIVITSGGLGPTVDDPTRMAVSQALHKPLVFHPELWEMIQNRFLNLGRDATLNNKKQAFLPEGAIVVHNPVGTAPAFIIENDKKTLISLPGVPNELKYLFQHSIIPFLITKYPENQRVFMHVIHLAGIGESVVDQYISTLETHKNPTVGLLAHPGNVDIRVAAKASNQQEAEKMMAPYLAIIQENFADSIYGMDGDTLFSTINSLLFEKNIILDIDQNQYGFSPNAEIFNQKELAGKQGINLKMNVQLHETQNHFMLEASLESKVRIDHFEKRYVGPKENVNEWAQIISMDFLRRSLKEY